MRVRHRMWMLLVLPLTACVVDTREGKVDPEEIWPDAPGGEPAPEPLPFEDRASGARYGLPRAKQASLADLIVLFPTTPLSVDEPDMFVAPHVEVATDQCRGGEVVELPELPLTIEAVVTLFPRQYMKLPICGQDERHYGVYTIEDDTGGLLVLRDSRVAAFGHGDHVRLTVSGITLTYGRDVDTRAILLADVEPTGESGPVLYSQQESAITADDVGYVRRIEGSVWQEPSNANFSELVLVNTELAGDVRLADLTGAALSCALSCEPKCNASCPKTALCGTACAELCKDAEPGRKLTPEEIPVCWIVGMGQELGKRGLTYPKGTNMRVTGPVVNNYERQIWVLDPRQVELLGD